MNSLARNLAVLDIRTLWYTMAGPGLLLWLCIGDWEEGSLGAPEGSMEVIYIWSFRSVLSHQPLGTRQMANREGSGNLNIWPNGST